MDSLPDHLREWWEPGLWCLHSAPWWRRHWERTGIVTIEMADTIPEGWRAWLDWQRVVAPDNATEVQAVDADRGRYLGYVRVVGRRRPDAPVPELIASVPVEYKRRSSPGKPRPRRRARGGHPATFRRGAAVNRRDLLKTMFVLMQRQPAAGAVSTLIGTGFPGPLRSAGQQSLWPGDRTGWRAVFLRSRQSAHPPARSADPPDDDDRRQRRARLRRRRRAGDRRRR